MRLEYTLKKIYKFTCLVKLCSSQLKYCQISNWVLYPSRNKNYEDLFVVESVANGAYFYSYAILITLMKKSQFEAQDFT